jgi:hypothetical protein
MVVGGEREVEPAEAPEAEAAAIPGRGGDAFDEESAKARPVEPSARATATAIPCRIAG